MEEGAMLACCEWAIPCKGLAQRGPLSVVLDGTYIWDLPNQVHEPLGGGIRVVFSSHPVG